MPGSTSEGELLEDSFVFIRMSISMLASHYTEDVGMVSGLGKKGMHQFLELLIFWL